MTGESLPLGAPVEWSPAQPPRRRRLEGRHVLLRPVDADADAERLYTISHPPEGDPLVWRYMFDGPYGGVAEMRAALERVQASEDPLFFTLVRLPERVPAGVASYLRIVPEHGVIEIGNIWFGPDLRRSTAATEAIYLLARHALDELGYRRLEWKCDALNAASRRAAERFGFQFEGLFRNHMVVKGRNRDTAWYAIVESDWPAIRRGLQCWLSPENFDEHGRQRRRLKELIGGAQGADRR